MFKLRRPEPRATRTEARDFRAAPRTATPSGDRAHVARFGDRAHRLLNFSPEGFAIAADDRRPPPDGMVALQRFGSTLHQGYALHAWGRNGVVGYKLLADMPVYRPGRSAEQRVAAEADRLRRRVETQLRDAEPEPHGARAGEAAAPGSWADGSSVAGSWEAASETSVETPSGSSAPASVQGADLRRRLGLGRS